MAKKQESAKEMVSYKISRGHFDQALSKLYKPGDIVTVPVGTRVPTDWRPTAGKQAKQEPPPAEAQALSSVTNTGRRPMGG